MKPWPGQPFPLGSTYDGMGTNFSVFSERSERIELCLFDSDGRESRCDLPEASGFLWHGYLPKVEPGQRYGYRAHGPWDPARGQLFNARKLLLDPYAKAVEGHVRWNDSVFPYRIGGQVDERSDSDSAASVPRSVVTLSHFDWEGDRAPQTPWHETVVYELHVKGFTARHPDVPPELRGTYGALGHPTVITYLKQLGVTAVELMPVHQFVHDRRLVERGLRNYWGYNSIAYFAPHNEYASDREPARVVAEFKRMVRELHAAGIEVILDVVYNHTAEGNHLGPMLCFKGLDNAAYYRVSPEDARYYVDYTGTGNSLNMHEPFVLQLIMDSLRYWVLEMHVDGFRFDLAATLARELHDVDHLSSFFEIIQQDPVLSQVKLIAEPWDLGAGGYQVGKFPPLWSEWNGKYRDCVRDFWRGADQTLGELAYRLTGSSDLYQDTARLPHASVNFVTCHDGFTLRDLVSYSTKHNEANGEDAASGEDFNRSWNCGVEGDTSDPAVLALRARQQRNLLATLALSQGVPMLLHGDELGRTQRGNNNAYCQDCELSWIDWEHADRALLAFVQELVRLRREHPVFHRRRWFRGRAIHGSQVFDIGWLKPDGEPIEEENWGEANTNALGVYLNGQGIAHRARDGSRIVDDSFYLCVNAADAPQEFRLPPAAWGERWRIVFETTERGFVPEDDEVAQFFAGDAVGVDARSLTVLRRLQ
jgi:isoamylase